MCQGTAVVRLKVEANGAGIRLHIVMAIDVELLEHQQAIQPLAVLECVATG